MGTGTIADATSASSVLKVLTDLFREVSRVRAADPDAKGCMAVNCVAELIGDDGELGALIENAVLSSLDRLEHLLHHAAKIGEIEDDGNLRDRALALQNLLIGLNVMSKVVRSEEKLWAAAKLTLKGLGLYKE